MVRVGLIINPVAGIGGRVGLKGSDGARAAEARRRGAEGRASVRARQTLERLVGVKELITIVSYPNEMGASDARAAGFEPQVLGRIASGMTTSADTRAAARTMMEESVDLLLFAGGDGTAVDVLRAVNGSIPVLGIPAGVKMHSAVFAINPPRAADLAILYARGQATETHEAEVVDVDEDALRDGAVSQRLYGYLRVPTAPGLVQNLKTRGGIPDASALASIAAEVAERMLDGRFYVLGPGSTTSAISQHLGLESTLLGVDIIRGGKSIALDVAERRLLDLISGDDAVIVVTPIGGQGFIFGRGNQQISPAAIQLAGTPNVVIVATEAKIAELCGRPLLVDTGDRSIDADLVGYARIVTGYHRTIIYAVAA